MQIGGVVIDNIMVDVDEGLDILAWSDEKVAEMPVKWQAELIQIRSLDKIAKNLSMINDTLKRMYGYRHEES